MQNVKFALKWAFAFATLSGLLCACVQRPMTYSQWKAEQAKKARIEQLRREGKAMSDTPVVFTKEEQARASK